MLRDVRVEHDLNDNFSGLPVHTHWQVLQDIAVVVFHDLES